MKQKETIAAIATAMGTAGISIIRISGKDAISITDRIFKAKNQKCLAFSKSHTIHYGYIMEEGHKIDEVLVLIMKAPNTYTKENIVEIDCHGGAMVTNRILQVVIRNGARLAEPGEFTKRAFLNGRLDLSQAEAVIDIIHAENEYALQSSMQQLSGNLRRKIEELRKQILLELSFLEAALDDPEHICLDGFSEKLSENIEKWSIELKKLLSTADTGRILREGVKTAIIGKPNAGKSSLLNLLAGQERAIVTEIAGTTRDVLEEQILLQGGLSLILMDTAGIHNSSDQVEKIGIEKAKASLYQADLILFVFDVSKGFSEEDKQIAELIEQKPVIILLNKIDLKEEWNLEDFEIKFPNLKDAVKIPFSAKKGIGLEQLQQRILSMFYQGAVSYNNEIFLTRARHKESIENAINSLFAVKESIACHMPEDFFSIDLMDAYEALGKIIGEAVEDDLVNTIFKEFCMGK